LQGAAAAGAIALVNSLGNFGGFLGPAAIGFAKTYTNSYAASLLSIAVFLAVGAVLVIWDRVREQRAACHIAGVT
jgi:ACS family tartrate transporter-like MFS transporter